MRPSISPAPLLVLLLLCSWAEAAQTSNTTISVAPEPITAEEVVDIVETRRNAQLAQEWGITPEEYRRYQTLMQGPRGIYSPGLDPITTLGIEARSEQERQRFAELQVHMERQRVDKELEFQRAYDEAYARLFPGEKAFRITQGITQGTSTSNAPTLQSSGRLAVFVRDGCQACITTVQQLQSANRPFDLYVVGSHGDDERIRRWAILAGISPDNVKNRVITLNHDEGRWLSLNLGGELPAQVLQVNGQWLRQ